MSEKSNRRLAFDALMDIAKKARNGSYYVKRGPIVWEEFEFAKYPRAISIQIPERDFMRQTNKVECALAFAGPIEGDPAAGQIDEALLDKFDVDADAIIREWLRAADAIGSFVMSFTPGKIAEFHDLDWKFQGIDVTFTIEI